LLGILDKISSGRGKASDIDELESLSNTIINASLCGLGMSSPNPVLSTLKHFRSEYLAHLEKKCPAAVCQNLVDFEITDKCAMCTQCIRICPVNAIVGELKQPHTLCKDKCIKCGKCIPVCPTGAIVRV